MLNIKKLILAIVSIASFSLTATELETEKDDPISYWSLHPLHIGGNAIQLGSADVRDVSKGGELTFGKYNIFADLLVPVTKKTYFFPRVDWTTFTLDWNHNPKFNQKQFDYAQFSLTFFSIEMEKWRWIMRASYNLDIKYFDNPSQYGLFTGLIWGSNEVNEKLNCHFGAYGYTGMEGDQIWPVIGFDYSPTKKWTLFAVFPIEYFIQYKIDHHWQLALKVRPLKERFRVGAKELQPKSIFSYTSVGSEFNIHYEIFRRFEFEAYGGWNFGGEFYIKDEFGNNPLYTHTGGAPYGGISLNWGL
jgi:hypothetical protein